MAGLAALYNVPMDPDELSTWSFVHQAHHRDIISVLQNLGVTGLDSYCLDPFDPRNMGQWLDLHQAMHQQVDLALKINGFDLDAVNWEDANERSGWVYLNAVEHTFISNALGIG
jgi:hypothetical protein